MDYLIGGALAVATAVFATVVGFDRSRAFYPVVLIIVATYYALFAVMGGSRSVLWPELLIIGGFVAVSVLGFKTSLWFVVAGLLGHGALDAVHSALIDNPGVPEWWPSFCAAFDVVVAGCLAMRMWRGKALLAFPAAHGEQERVLDCGTPE